MEEEFGMGCDLLVLYSYIKLILHDWVLVELQCSMLVGEILNLIWVYTLVGCFCAIMIATMA